MKNKTVAYCAIIVGIILIGLTIMYWSVPAGSLPKYMPGFEAGSLVTHFKHGLASLVLALGLFSYAWFQTGKTKQSIK